MNRNSNNNNEKEIRQEEEGEEEISISRIAEVVEERIHKGGDVGDINPEAEIQIEEEEEEEGGISLRFLHKYISQIKYLQLPSSRRISLLQMKKLLRK
jgi:hypothetical protein